MDEERKEKERTKERKGRKEAATSKSLAESQAAIAIKKLLALEVKERICILAAATTLQLSAVRWTNAPKEMALTI